MLIFAKIYLISKHCYNLALPKFYNILFLVWIGLYLILMEP